MNARWVDLQINGYAGVDFNARKADAVAAAVDGPLTPLCPSSVLRTHPACTLYLDPPAAAKLKV